MTKCLFYNNEMNCNIFIFSDYIKMNSHVVGLLRTPWVRHNGYLSRIRPTSSCYSFSRYIETNEGPLKLYNLAAYREQIFTIE